MTAPYSETDTCWHILTVTEGGKVSILKNLDAPTARQAYQRLAPHWRRPVEYVNIPEGTTSWGGSGGYTGSKSDIDKVEVLGPEGADLDVWRGYKKEVVDVGANIQRRRDHAAAVLDHAAALLKVEGSRPKASPASPEKRKGWFS